MGEGGAGLENGLEEEGDEGEELVADGEVRRARACPVGGAVGVTAEGASPVADDGFADGGVVNEAGFGGGEGGDDRGEGGGGFGDVAGRTYTL